MVISMDSRPYARTNSPVGILFDNDHAFDYKQKAYETAK